jgi:membrane associated rhomboid family serine protease
MNIINELTASFNQIIHATQQNASVLMWIIAIMFGFFFLNALTQGGLFSLGIVPRSKRGLLGIIFAPFLHANFNHLFFNCIPLVVLSDFVLIEGLDVFLNVSFYIILLSGFLTWLFARHANHIGASGVITGYWGYLVINVYLHESILGLVLGIICVYYFAGIFLGIFPQQRGVSWEGHLFGLISGVAVNFLFKYYPYFFIQ